MSWAHVIYIYWPLLLSACTFICARGRRLTLFFFFSFFKKKKPPDLVFRWRANFDRNSFVEFLEKGKAAENDDGLPFIQFSGRLRVESNFRRTRSLPTTLVHAQSGRFH